MVNAKLAILIASFAFSTAAMAKPSVPKNLNAAAKKVEQTIVAPETGTTQNNIAPANCPQMTAASGSWNENREAAQRDVSGALKARSASKGAKPAKQNTRF